MKGRIAVGAMMALITLVTVATPALAKTNTKPARATHYYVALGDSLSVGYQPNSAGVGRETNQGYANDLTAYYKKRVKGLKLQELGCPGETTESMLKGSLNGAAAKQFKCARVKGSQLGAAEAFLKAHRGSVSLVTIDIGANDLDGCASDPSAIVTCALDGIKTIQTNLPIILGGVRKAAGKGVKLVAMNLYDPFLAYYLEGPYSSLQPLGEESVELLGDVNKSLAAIDAKAGFKTADVGSAFKSTDTTSTLFQGQEMPVNVAEICSLTWMCAAAPVGPNIHANPFGYLTIAGAFEDVIGKL